MIVQINEILREYFERKLGAPRVYDELKIASAWAKLNTKVAENAHPEKLLGGVLYISVKNSAWAQQINMLKHDIMLRLNESIGEKLVKDLRIHAGAPGDRAEKEVERKKGKCGQCGEEYFGEGSLCPICSREKKQAGFTKLYRMVRKNPKAGISEARKEYPEIEDREFRRIKRDINAINREREERKKYAKKGA